MEKAERETTMTYDVESQEVSIFSAIGRDQGRLKRAGFKPVYGNSRQGYGYKVPLSRFKWRVAKAGASKRGFASQKPRTTTTNMETTGAIKSPSLGHPKEGSG